MTISLCMIVKNEESILRRCLDSIKNAVDEIIIIDTGSKDNTKLIALEYTNYVYDFSWIDDFSAARNFAYSKAIMDYQMWLDADDIVPKETNDGIIKLKNDIDNSYDMITMKYITHFDKNNNPVHSTTRERLTKRHANFIWKDPVHEYIALSGKILHTDMEIHHKKPKEKQDHARNLNIYAQLEEASHNFTPRQMYYFARELKDHMKFEKSVYYFEKFLESKKGWNEDNIATCFNLSFCYQRTGKNNKILQILLKSFEYDAPRAENCCQIGYYYKNLKQYALAYKWFDIAANLKPPKSLGFILWDYWGYIPNIECFSCLCELKNYNQAAEYNKKAAEYKPDSIAVAINKSFLEASLKTL